MRGFIMLIASAPAGERVDQTRLVASAFAALEVGRAMIVIRKDTERVAAWLPDGWRAVQDEWLDALADVFSAATTESRVRATNATLRAEQALARVEPSVSTADSLLIKRMRRLMRFSALMLGDDTLPLWQAANAAKGVPA